MTTSVHSEGRFQELARLQAQSTSPSAVGGDVSAEREVDACRGVPASVLQGKLLETVRQHSAATIEFTPSITRILPLFEGFPIEVDQSEKGSTIVCMGGWIEDEIGDDGVVSLVGLALAGRLRLRSEYLGGKPWINTLEIERARGIWVESGQMGYVRIPWWWRRRTVRVFQYPNTDPSHPGLPRDAV